MKNFVFIRSYKETTSSEAVPTNIIAISKEFMRKVNYQPDMSFNPMWSGRVEGQTFIADGSGEFFINVKNGFAQVPDKGTEFAIHTNPYTKETDITRHRDHSSMLYFELQAGKVPAIVVIRRDGMVTPIGYLNKED